jgi:hypothetical protein
MRRCAVAIPTIMNELNSALSAKPGEIETHVSNAKRLL